jgi:hypothetical protein
VMGVVVNVMVMAISRRCDRERGTVGAVVTAVTHCEALCSVRASGPSTLKQRPAGL